MIRIPKPSNPPIFDLRRVGFPTGFAVLTPVTDFVPGFHCKRGGEKLEIYCWFADLYVPSALGSIMLSFNLGWGYNGEPLFITGGFTDRCGLSIVP